MREMRKGNGKARAFHGALAMLLLLSFLLMAGCGKQTGEPVKPSEPAQTPTPPVAAASAKTTETVETAAVVETGTPQPEDGMLRVSSVEELLKAVAPEVEILLAPGRYDLTEFLDGFANVRDQDAWNEEHPYVKLDGVFDGVEVTIRGVSGLSIKGGSDDPGETEIVTEPRYAAVMNFEDCTDVELACLTMGHTEQGDCSGNVLDFEDCGNICLRTMDLYGCGVYGIRAHGCGDLTVSNSTIRDCAYGSVDIGESIGDNLFTACTLSGSNGAGYYTPTAVSTLAFVGCYFGEGESTGWYFRNTAAFENCEWSEPTSYPDREDPLDVTYGFYPERMEQVPFDYGCLGRSCRIGYAEVDPQSGETEYFGLMGQDYKSSLLVTLDLDEEGTGTLAFGTEKESVSWEFMDGGVACKRGDGSNLYFFLYKMSLPGGEGWSNWMMMQGSGNNLIWLY